MRKIFLPIFWKKKVKNNIFIILCTNFIGGSKKIRKIPAFSTGSLCSPLQGKERFFEHRRPCGAQQTAGAGLCQLQQNAWTCGIHRCATCLQSLAHGIRRCRCISQVCTYLFFCYLLMLNCKKVYIYGNLIIQCWKLNGQCWVFNVE